MESAMEIDWFQEYDNLKQHINDKQMEYWDKQYNKSEIKQEAQKPQETYKKRNQWMNSYIQEYLSGQPLQQMQSLQEKSKRESHFQAPIQQQVTTQQITAQPMGSQAQLEQLNEQLTLTRSQVESMRYNIINNGAQPQLLDINTTDTYPVYNAEQTNQKVQQLNITSSQEDDTEVIVNQQPNLALTGKSVHFQDQQYKSTESSSQQNLIPSEVTFVDFNEKDNQKISQVSVFMPNKSQPLTPDVLMENTRTINLQGSMFSGKQQQCPDKNVFNQLWRIQQDNNKVIKPKRVLDAFTAQAGNKNYNLPYPYSSQSIFVKNRDSPLQIGVDIQQTNEHLRDMIRQFKTSNNAMNINSI